MATTPGNAPRKKWLLIVAMLVLLIGLVSRIPAAVALNWALPDRVETRGISGTVWRGSIDALRVDGTALDPVDWQLRPLALLTGRIGASIEAGLPGGFFAGDVSLSAGRIRIRDARAALDLAPVTRLSTIGPSEGSVRLTIREAEIDALWPVRLDGEMVLTGLRYPPVGPQPLGSYRLEFDPALASDPAFPVSASLSTLDGPFAVDGRLLLGENRSYSMRAGVAPKPDTDQQLRNALRILGPAGPDGSHQLNFDGNL